MKNLRVWIMLAAGLLALAWMAAPARAGGWATITLDEWPQGIVAGQSWQVSFTVRQHGQDDRKMNDLNPTITFTHAASGERLVVDAAPLGQDGRYRAEARLPLPGEWGWSIQAFTMDMHLPKLMAGAPAAAPTVSLPVGGAGLAAAGGVGLLAALGLAGRRRFRWAAALAAAGLALGGFGLASAAAGRAALPAESDPVARRSPAEMGEILFVAKGCALCHSHNGIERGQGVFNINLAPNLSNYSASAEFLRLWLNDPRAIKPQTQMPNLELSPEEIEALIAFLANDR